MAHSTRKEVQFAARGRSASEDSQSTTATSTTSSRKPPPSTASRTARFAEVTAVNSPVGAEPGPYPFTHPTPQHFMAQPQVSDVGFGYVNKHDSVEMPNTDDEPPVTAREMPQSPLKSAMKTPGAPPPPLPDIRSPTFQQEELLEKHEKFTEKEQARDIKIKTRVRVAKFLLRGVNFSCSLIVLAMLASTFAIFNATKALPTRNNLPPWAVNQKTWPQVLLLCIACVSLAACIVVFYAYWTGGHRRAERAAVYYTAFAVVFFVFSIVMWGAGAAAMQQSKNNSHNKDLWGWACVDNERKSLFQHQVDYELVCRLQSWSVLCAIIEIVVELITISVYGIVFARFYSKRRLRKSMAARDRARSHLYLAHLRSPSALAPPPHGAPAPFSPRDGGWIPPPHHSSYHHAPDLEAAAPPFRLQPPPPGKLARATPPATAPPPPRDRTPSPSPPAPPLDPRSPLLPAAPAPGEPLYDPVPIPAAYDHRRPPPCAP